MEPRCAAGAFASARDHVAIQIPTYFQQAYTFTTKGLPPELDSQHQKKDGAPFGASSRLASAVLVALLAGLRVLLTRTAARGSFFAARTGLAG